ncbi:MAG: hypothetical protein IKL10_02815 [Clostridia bacterium]|nr:hypothetical protein [Clostridia bacterium]
MTAEKDGKSFEADIICNSYEDIEIKFTTPKELSGFSIVTSEDGYKVNVFGVPDDISEDEVNDASLLNILIEALKISVFTNHGLFTEKEESFDANLTVDGIPVFVSFTEDGHIRRMEASMIGFSADFEISG